MRIDNLNQYGTYNLVFPLYVNGLPVNTITDAKFQIYDQNNDFLEATLENGKITFNVTNGRLTVKLFSEDTETLAGNYTYELWVKLGDGRPYHTMQGNIQFNKTKVRF